MNKWEDYAPGVRRLPVAGGWIYDIGGMEATCAVFVPHPPRSSDRSDTPMGRDAQGRYDN